MNFKKGDLVVYEGYLYRIKSCGLLLREHAIPIYDLVNEFGGTVGSIREEELQLYPEIGGVL
jgi:hypothetical protein